MKIIDTTDNKYVGHEIDINARPILLGDTEFYPDKVVQIGEGIWRLYNTNYVIDVQE